jgi:hypothetical protein
MVHGQDRIARCGHADNREGHSVLKHAKGLVSPVLLALALGLGLAQTSTAEPPPECGEWTLFPDFTCEGHEARPDDAFNPVGMPYLFEDPYNTTGLNFVYIYHGLPDSGGLGVAFDGGGAHVMALQIRLALTERLGFIATKDGLVMLRPGNASAVAEETGIFDMTAGFKYKLFESKENNFVLSPAIRYEIPMGNKGLYQNYGKGVFIPSASFRWGLGKLGLEGANIVGSLGGQVPVSDNKNVSSLFYNLHLDYGIKIDDSFVKWVVPFFEMNAMHYTSNGNGTNKIKLRGGGSTTVGAVLPLTGPFEGFDVANLGSPGIKGSDVVVLGGGFRVPTTWGISFAVMYEGPVTRRHDIHNQRFTFMATWEL